MAKPLMSPLLLENSNITKEPPGQASQASQSSNNGSEVDCMQITRFTPKTSTELKAQAIKFQKLQEQDHSTQRLLFRKIIKSFEEHECVLADYELKIQSLEV
jgi:hypothetical protein